MAGWGGQTGGGVAREEGEGQEAPPDGGVARRPEQAPAEGAGRAAFGGFEGGDGRGVRESEGSARFSFLGLGLAIEMLLFFTGWAKNLGMPWYTRPTYWVRPYRLLGPRKHLFLRD